MFSELVVSRARATERSRATDFGAGEPFTGPRKLKETPLRCGETITKTSGANDRNPEPPRDSIQKEL